MRRLSRTLFFGMLVTVAASCADGTGPGNEARVSVDLSVSVLRSVALGAAAPADYIAAAFVDIGRVELIPGDGGEPLLVSEDGTVGEIDLLELAATATAHLGSVAAEPGFHMSQLRLVVESARVQLAEGYEFREGGTEQDLFVPSGAQTGIKLVLKSVDGGSFVVPEGETTFVVDFDVTESYVLQGNPGTPAGIQGVLFRPTLRVVIGEEAGSV
jgi:hypothetical protein